MEADARALVRKARAEVARIRDQIDSEFDTSKKWGGFDWPRRAQLAHSLAEALDILSKARSLATALVMKAKAK